MIYNEGSPNGSESSDSDRNEGKKNGDACEGNVDNSVDNVNVESRNVVNHVGKLLHSNPMYTSCHVFSHHEIGIKGEEDNKFTDGNDLSGISHGDANAEQMMQRLEGSSINAEAANTEAEQNLIGTDKIVSQVNVNNTADNQSNAPTCKYVDINVQIDCWGDEEVSTTSSEFSVDTELACIVDLFSPTQIPEKIDGEQLEEEKEEDLGSPNGSHCIREVQMSSPGDMVRDNPRSLWGDSNANSPIVRDGRRREREEGVNTTPLEPPRQRSDITVHLAG